MGYGNKMRMGGSKSFLSLFVAFCMVFSLLSVALSEPIQAKSTRAAIIVDVKGTVTVKKSGGSKSYTAYGDMTLNQGDVIFTGAESSAVIRIADHDDEISIGDNAEVSITDLASEKNGKQSKVSSWAGSMWVKVKSLVGSDDEFEVETPTAVMAVRGTQFFMGVDPITGNTFVSVGAGAVLTTTTTYNEPDTNNSQQERTTLLLPTQQISLTDRKEVSDLNVKVEIVDIYKLVEQASPALLEIIIKNKAEIDRENQVFLDKKRAEIAEKNKADTGNSALTINDIETLNRISKNLDNVIGNIAKIALEQKKISPEKMKEILNDANNRIEALDKKIDLNKVEPLDHTAGVDAEKERIKQEELAKLETLKAMKLAEQLKMENELKNKLKSVLEAVELEKKRVAAANKKVEEETAKKAEQDFIKQLSPSEKASFEASKTANSAATGTSTTGTGTTTGGSGGGSSSGSGNSSNNNNASVPVAPNLISPAQPTTVTTGNVQIKLKAPFTSNIQILNGNTVLSTLTGQGDNEVVFDLALLNGVYNLTARSERAQRYSASVSIPPITVNNSEQPIVADVVLAQGGVTGGVANLNLSLKNFLPANQFYAVEAHLVYKNSDFSYTGPTTITDVNGTVFDGASTAETMRQVTGSTQSELIYAASQFETAANTGTINNLTVSGEKLLVAIPLQVGSGSVNPATVDLVYVKIVDKTGAVVYELGSGLAHAPKSLSVTTK
ncbi:FecR family protein [Paenibacillus agricola]|uniref:FecR protein domain-containing protein n=1 Tax=Paenibacillus agricola TaxID=2716264 RepID=A0ABX0J4I5_9BACL|nr:FecR family protein [Paenibacillus agricola]NHN31235.1 hypothetical protein [Paenibacillus agricola]